MTRTELQRTERLGQERINKQGCLMKIIEYTNWSNIIVEFQDEYKQKVHTSYQCFQSGKVKNSYAPFVCGVGMTGNKYSAKIKGKNTKEYQTWRNMLLRCFSEKEKEKYPAYKDVTCCKEWLLFENFYEWLHKQENFKKWLNGERWALDKDILIKGNKIYSPETCCLVPQNVNNLFIKNEKHRGGLPVGIYIIDNKFVASCQNPITRDREYLGYFALPDDAFYLGYKPYKENLIKQIARIEYDKGNITKRCYDAMMNYIVEIDD